MEVTNEGAGNVSGVVVEDVFPHGFAYISGSTSASISGVGEPVSGNERILTWTLGEINPGVSVRFSYAVVVGPDSQKGDGRNVATARGISVGKAVTSVSASFKVKINEGVFTTRGTIIGKVFHDINRDGIQQEDEEGISGVAIFLENGIRVVTDRNGKYTVSGLLPGTHVLRLDEKTLPEDLLPAGQGTRFAGNASSQFVELPPSGLMKVNFPLTGKEKQCAVINTIQVASYQEKDLKEAVEVARKLQKENFPDVRVELIGKYYCVRAGRAEDSVSLLSLWKQIKKIFPAAIIRKGYFLPDRIVYPERKSTASLNQPEIDLQSPVLAPSSGSQQVREKEQDQLQVAKTSFSGAMKGVSSAEPLEKQILTMTPELAFLSPKEGDILSNDVVTVLVKTPLETNLNLFLNGKLVEKERVGRRIEHSAGRVSITEFIGLNLVPGQKNVLRAEIHDSFGNKRGSQEISVVCAGLPAGIVIQTDSKEIPADDKSVLTVKCWVVDRNGWRLTYPRFFTVETSLGEILGQDADLKQSGFQVESEGGVASFRIKAPYQPGEAVIRVSYGRMEESCKVFFAPHLRNLFLVGLGEITLGYGKSKGKTEFLKREKWFDENWYAGSRGAFYLKGSVFKDILLTAGYDSHKPEAADYFGNRTVDPEAEELYPLYGDESRFSFETSCREKLYVRLDRGRSYLMYGDIQTDLRDTTLGAFTRTLTGIKMEHKTEKIEVKAFASRTDQVQVVETFPGRGISGFYYLSHSPVVEGSELVVIEIRDRRQMERIISRQAKVRTVYYFIDYDTGTILFKEAIPGYDTDFNPVFIVVSYETSGGRKHYLYGGRAVLKAGRWLELGLTAVTEENEVSDYLLAGADLTLRLPGNTTVKTEVARTSSLFPDNYILNLKKDWGWMVNVESHPLENLSFLAHYRDIGTWFGNPSAIDALRGMRNYSVDISYLLGNSTKLKTQLLREEDILNNTKHQYAGLGIEKKENKTHFLVELYHETSEGNYVPAADPNSRFPFDNMEQLPENATGLRFRLQQQINPDISLFCEHRHNFLSSEGIISQAGLDFRLEKNRKFYLRQEYGQYAGRTETRTAIGMEAEIFPQTLAFNEYRLSDVLDGRRGQQVIGLRNRFLLAPGVSGDIRIENLSTLSGKERLGQPDGFSIATGLEYLPGENIKWTGRLEYYHQTAENSYLAEFGAAYRFSCDYCLLFRQRFFLDEINSGQRSTGRTLLGMAYRPTEHDRFHGLLKAEFKREKDGMSDSGYNNCALIFSAEGHYQINSKTQISGKYAGKLARDCGFSSYTDLVSAIFIRDLTDRFDFSLAGRILRSHLVGNVQAGGSMEFGWRMVKNVWLSLGYSFDDFDSDLVGDSYQGRGPFLKLRFKFDESVLHSLHKSR